MFNLAGDSAFYLSHAGLCIVKCKFTWLSVWMNCLVICTSGKSEKKTLICTWHTYCQISTNKSKISQIHPETWLISTHFCLICNLMHLIKWIKSTSQQKANKLFFWVFLMLSSLLVKFYPTEGNPYHAAWNKINESVSFVRKIQVVNRPTTSITWSNDICLLFFAPSKCTPSKR